MTSNKTSVVTFGNEHNDEFQEIYEKFTPSVQYAPPTKTFQKIIFHFVQVATGLAKIKRVF